MPQAYFVVPYLHERHRLTGLQNTRRCWMDTQTATIRADGGTWTEIEISGDKALVIVDARNPTLNAIASALPSGSLRLASRTAALSTRTLTKLAPRYDVSLDDIVLDGAVRPVETVDELDAKLASLILRGGA